MKGKAVPVHISTLNDAKVPGTNLYADTTLIESELFARIDSDDLQTAIEIGTQLWPNRSFCFLNEQQLLDQANFFQQHFLPLDKRKSLAYAVKANPRGRILALLHEAGLETFDCASVGEIEQVKRFCPSATPLFTHPFKFPEEIAQALSDAVRYFTVQTRQEVSKILDVAADENIPEDELELAVRLRSLNEQASIDLSQKFGTDEETVQQLLFMIDRESDAQAALSTNTGSQNQNPHSYALAVQKLAELAQTIAGVSSINLGGGFPVNYHEEEQFCLEEYLSTVSKAVHQHAFSILTGENPRVIIEPGRALVAQAVDLVIPIRGVEEREGQKVLVIDDGLYTSLFDAVLHPGWEYKLKAQSTKTKKKSKKKIPTIIFGRTCDSGDKLPQAPLLPENLEEGDYLQLPNAGAYTDGTATEFNSFPPPHYISYALMNDS